MDKLKEFLYLSMQDMENLFFYFNDEYINAFGEGQTSRMNELTSTINAIAKIRCDLQKEIDFIESEEELQNEDND